MQRGGRVDTTGTGGRPGRDESKRTSLLIADDDRATRWLVKFGCGARFADIADAEDGRELRAQLAYLARVHPDREVVVVADVGLDVGAAYDQLGYHPATVVMTASLDARARAVIERAGGLVLPKPFTTTDLRRVVERACR
jgi:hypothetical protein